MFRFFLSPNGCTPFWNWPGLQPGKLRPNVLLHIHLPILDSDVPRDYLHLQGSSIELNISQLANQKCSYDSNLVRSPWLPSTPPPPLLPPPF